MPRKFTHKKWSDKDIVTLRVLHNSGLSDNDIAKELGRTESAVFNRRIREGLVRTKKLGKRKKHRAVNPVLSPKQGPLCPIPSIPHPLLKLELKVKSKSIVNLTIWN